MVGRGRPAQYNWEGMELDKPIHVPREQVKRIRAAIYIRNTSNEQLGRSARYSIWKDSESEEYYYSRHL